MKLRAFTLAFVVAACSPAARSAESLATQIAPAPTRTVTSAALATPLERQVADLQNQVAMLQAQLNALLAAIQVTEAGVVLQGPRVTIAAGAVDIRTSGNLTLTGANLAANLAESTALRSGTTFAIASGASMTVQTSATLDLRGATTRLNGGNKPIATIGSAVQAPNGSGQVTTGSLTVFTN